MNSVCVETGWTNDIYATGYETYAAIETDSCLCPYHTSDYGSVLSHGDTCLANATGGGHENDFDSYSDFWGDPDSVTARLQGL